MKKIIFLFFFPCILFQLNNSYAQADSMMLRKIYTEALTNGKSYSNLDYLSNKIGGRLSGSPAAQKAVEWAFAAMKEAGADTVYLQECMVPHWIRGEKEIGKVMSTISSENKPLPIAALGGSIGTPAGGITAPIIEVTEISELEQLGKRNIEGKIVFFNKPMNPAFIETFLAYRDAVGQRWGGASEAAKYGAVAVLVRSCTTLKDDHPHTGAMGYTDSLHKIPACSISTNGADWLSDHLKQNKELKFFMKTNCQTLPDERSYNVIGEIFGYVHPDEYIVVGGHLDSWDLGTGANDDGAGVVQSIEVIRLFKALGIRPNRNIRAVAFMNEENGTRGGKKYAELAKLNNEKHIAAIESDNGGFSPRGITSVASPAIKNKISSWRPLFEPYGVYDFNKEGTGSDLKQLVINGVPCFELKVDSQRYFDYHHTSTDTFDKVNKRELELGGATLAAFIWMINTHGFE